MDRRAERGVTAVEAAVMVALVGSLLAVAVPAFVRELHASRFVEGGVLGQPQVVGHEGRPGADCHGPRRRMGHRRPLTTKVGVSVGMFVEHWSIVGQGILNCQHGRQLRGGGELLLYL